MRKDINIYNENCRTKNEYLQRASVDVILLQTFSIKNHWNLSFFKKSRNKAETWYESLCFNLAMKNSMPNSVEYLLYIKWHSSICHSLLKAQAILSNTIIKRSAVSKQELKSCWKLEKRQHFMMWWTWSYLQQKRD